VATVRSSNAGFITPSGSYRVNRGSHGVVVGIMDTGIDGSHPDIRPNFNRQLSRNFTTDIPLIDEGGHGTHVAGLVAAALNGLGTAGVAPKVTLVNIRAGQGSGFFFLQPTVDAMVDAGLLGIDVINMSFFTDPWLHNCLDNPADSPEEQLEQLTVRVATQRAINFARNHGVTPVAALGNEHTDPGNPTVDEISPDFPPGSERTRTVDNSCITVPTETRGVISISALGPSGYKADYSTTASSRPTSRLRAGGSATTSGSPEPAAREPQPLAHAEGAGRGGPQGPGQRPVHPAGLQGHHLRLLPVRAGHLDGLAACRRDGHADALPVPADLRLPG